MPKSVSLSSSLAIFVKMISLSILRWYLLIGAVGIVFGFLIKTEQIPEPSDQHRAHWALPEYSSRKYDIGLAKEISGLAWWKEEKEGSVLAHEEGAEKVPTRKVSWDFRGVISVGSKSFALVADGADAPLKRYVPGDSLPGGEVLEVIDKQNIRFSLPGDEKGEDIKKELYAPAE